GHGRAVQAVRRPAAGAHATAGGRPADPLPHPRLRRRPVRGTAPGRRGGRGYRGRRHGAAVRADQPAEPNSLVEALRFTERDTGLAFEPLQAAADYWEEVRRYYAPFETGQLAASAETYLHEMPGGQTTNLYQQAQAMGLGDRWHEVGRMYAE